MQRYASSNARRLSRLLLGPPPPVSNCHLSLPHASGVPQQWHHHRTLSLLAPHAGIPQVKVTPSSNNVQQWRCSCSPVVRAYSAEASRDSGTPTEVVKDMYEKISKSVEAKSTPPNAWLWSLVGNCANKEDVNLLFQTLNNLRRFRLSALRISEDFNSHLCQRVAESCARAGAFDYGLKTLWKHNIYGLTPSIASAHSLLRRAKEHNDYNIMGKIMRVLQKNGLPLQPGTADIVFSICCNANKWDLISIYSRKFMKAGVKLHQTTFDTWMEFAANRGDAASIWEIEKLRSNSMKHQTLSSAFSCAKGFLLEKKPESAAAVIHVLSQNLPDQKKPNIAKELQKLAKWPSEVTKRQKGNGKALAISLKKEISKMVSSLTSMGLEVMIDLEEQEHGNGMPKGKVMA